MSEITSVVEAVERVGIPTLFFVLLIYLCFKLVPDFLKHWKEGHKTTQSYYMDRQKQYDDQMQVVIKIAEQGNNMVGQATQVIAQSNEIIRMNTEAIRSNTEVHKSVIEALGRDLVALQVLAADVKEHDKRAEKMYVGIEKLVDRTD